MADYWKSQPKKFCKYCKCWIADNKPSVEFHERGKNHKENVALKISEIKQKSIDKAKQDDKMSKEFAAMEAAAQKAYEEDMRRLGIESGSQVQTPPEPQAKPQPQVQSQPQRKEKKSRDDPASVHQPPVSEAEAWVEAKSDDGVTYYYNTVTGESKWVKPEGGEDQSKEPGSKWMEATSPDGYPYYYNTETGESSWERPADLPATTGKEESQEDNPSGGTTDQNDQPPTPKSEAPSGGEESSKGSKDGEGGEEPRPETKDEGGGGEETSSGKTGGVEETSSGKIPKINFRKRKGDENSDKKEGDGGGGGGSGDDDDESKDKKEEKLSKDEGDKMVADEALEETKAIPVKKPRKNTPYGAWEQIQVEEDPYEKVDLQLPQVEYGASVPTPTELPREPKHKFKERTITSLGTEGGATSFKKTKGQNAKSRNIRQRGDDD